MTLPAASRPRDDALQRAECSARGSNEPGPERVGPGSFWLTPAASGLAVCALVRSCLGVGLDDEVQTAAVHEHQPSALAAARWRWPSSPSMETQISSAPLGLKTQSKLEPSATAVVDDGPGKAGNRARSGSGIGIDAAEVRACCRPAPAGSTSGQCPPKWDAITARKVVYAGSEISSGARKNSSISMSGPTW